MWLGAACTTLVKADRSKVPDSLFADAGVGGASGGGVGGATGSDAGDAAVDTTTAGDALDAPALDVPGVDVPGVDGSALDLSPLDVSLDRSDGG